MKLPQLPEPSVKAGEYVMDTQYWEDMYSPADLREFQQATVAACIEALDEYFGDDYKVGTYEHEIFEMHKKLLRLLAKRALAKAVAV